MSILVKKVLENLAHIVIIIAASIYVTDRIWMLGCALKYDRDMKKGIDKKD